jgi:hypothetical protein
MAMVEKRLTRRNATPDPLCESRFATAAVAVGPCVVIPSPFAVARHHESLVMLLTTATTEKR